MDERTTSDSSSSMSISKCFLVASVTRSLNLFSDSRFSRLIAWARFILPLTKQAVSIFGMANERISSLPGKSASSTASLRSSSWIAHSSAIAVLAFSMAASSSSSGTSLPPPSTMVMPSAVPATTISSSAWAVCSKVG
jgi:hypothetical protein